MKPASDSHTPTIPHVFVNYTHPSQRHQKEQRFLIQSHVSGHYRRKNKQIVLSSTRTRPWQLPERKAESLPDSIPHLANIDHTAGDSKRRRSFSTDPQSDQLMCCPRRDPFDVYPIEARDCVPAAFDYYTKVFAPAHASVCGKNNAYLTKLVPLAMQHPVMFEGLIALSQSHLTANDDLGRPNKESLYHRGQALKLLRQRVRSLSTPPDDALIWTSVLLLGIDSVYRDHESWEAHMNGLIGMVKLRGGLHRIDPTLRTIILHARTMWILMTDKALIPNDPIFDIPFSSEQLPPTDLESSIQYLPAGFRSLALTNRLRQPILQMLCKICTDVGTIRLNPNEATALSNSFRASPNSLDEAIYFALLIYFLDDYGSTSCCVTYLRTLQKLADAVTQLLRPSEDRALCDCLVWILTVAEAGSKGTHWDDRFPFMDYMLQHFPESRDHARWRSALRGFFWSEARGREWEQVWTGAMRAFSGVEVEDVVDVDVVETASCWESSPPGSQRRMCCQTSTLPEVGCGMPAVWH